MIFYFTGTGNSYWAAQQLGEAFDEPLISISDELKKGGKEYSYTIGDDERILFVYPVHSWGPAVLVLQFISHLVLHNYKEQAIYSVCTCGDDCGYTDKIIAEALLQRNLCLSDSFSVQMPNNYILMPGFNVDASEIEQDKLKRSYVRMAEIITAIKEEHESSLYHQGSVPFLKSRLVYPLFSRFALGTNSFYATEACISCGICEKVCPTSTITWLEGGKPTWGNSCVQCVACIHRCPVRAIEYGKVTLKKGRYHHPDFK